MKDATKQEWLNAVNRPRILFRGLYGNGVKPIKTNETEPTKKPKRKRKARDIFDNETERKTAVAKKAA